MDRSIPSIDRRQEGRGLRISRRELLALSALGLVASAPARATPGGPPDQLTWAVHVSLAPT